MKTKYKTRDEVLRNKLVDALKTTDVDKVVDIIKDYESANLITIEKLSRIKKLDIKKISGALKQCIQAHGSITDTYISSAAKRIYGSIMLEDNCPDNSKTSGPFSVRGILLGFLIGMAVCGVIHLFV